MSNKKKCVSCSIHTDQTVFIHPGIVKDMDGNPHARRARFIPCCPDHQSLWGNCVFRRPSEHLAENGVSQTIKETDFVYGSGPTE